MFLYSMCMFVCLLTASKSSFTSRVELCMLRERKNGGWEGGKEGRKEGRKKEAGKEGRIGGGIEWEEEGEEEEHTG